MVLPIGVVGTQLEDLHILIGLRSVLVVFFMVACVPLLLDTLLSLAGIVSVVNNEASTRSTGDNQISLGSYY